MINTKLTILLLLILPLIHNCDCARQGQSQAITVTRTRFLVQGKVERGTIELNDTGIFAQGNIKNNFTIAEIGIFLNLFKRENIFIGEIAELPSSGRSSSNYRLPLFHKVLISEDFQGTMHIFTFFSVYHDAGSYTRSGNFSRDSIYGKALATELKAQGITDMYYRESTRAPLYPIGEKERIFITESSKPENIRALMQAAKAVKDPRLLVIERASSTGKVSITAFGETTQIDAGITYVWQFNQEQLKNLRQFIVKLEH